MYLLKDKTTTVTEKVIDTIICDDCKKKISMEKSEDIIERQELVSIRFTGGYGSVFGDEQTFQCDLCQHCLKKRLGDIIHPVNY